VSGSAKSAVLMRSRRYGFVPWSPSSSWCSELSAARRFL
jgi:hypothetical protein